MKVFRKGRQSDADIQQWLVDLRAQTRPFCSGYAAVAIFRARFGGAEDFYFAGGNVENIDHRLSIHGEEAAISAMITGLGKGAEIAEGWIMGAPKDAAPEDPEADNLGSCCGKCRQQIAGLADEKAVIHAFSLNGLRRAGTTVAAFLPDVFTFRHFMPDFRPAKETQPPRDIEARITRKGPLGEKEIKDWLAGLSPVDYATGIAETAVVELDNGWHVAGARVEDAAYIDISALQAALGIAAAEHPGARARGVWLRAKGALPLSALQVLGEFAADENIPVIYPDGTRTTLAQHLPAPVSPRRD